MKEFFHSWVFKVLLALCIVMFAFLLRATMTMGASTVVEQIVGTITAPVQSLTSGLSGSITGFLDQFLLRLPCHITGARAPGKRDFAGERAASGGEQKAHRADGRL